MQGIPVLTNGDPVRRTFVLAGSYQQFRHWCRFSRVNPNSRNIRYVNDAHCLRGVRDIDLVYTGTYYSEFPLRKMGDVNHVLRHLRALGEVKNDYEQYESCDIEPNIVDPATLVQT